MNIPVRRIVKTTMFGVVGLVLAAVALIVLPVYGAFMVIWLHVPVASILTTVGPVVVLFGLGAYACFRASRRACRGST
jgi:uncharacterized membrane protein YqjE